MHESRISKIYNCKNVTSDGSDSASCGSLDVCTDVVDDLLLAMLIAVNIELDIVAIFSLSALPPM